MNGIKKFIPLAFFSMIVALGLAGGSWGTTLAQGTVPPAPPAAPLAAPLLSSIIAAGDAHTCAITPADGFRCWGLNDSGQLGDGTNQDSAVPVFVEDVIASSVIDLTAGLDHTCALTSNSEVYCWGLNADGQLGDGTNENRNVPVLVQGLPKNLVAIDAGADFTCAETDDGNVFCWGNNSAGQLNDGTTTNRNVAVQADPNIVGNVLMVSGGVNELQGVTVDGLANYWSLDTVIPVTGLPQEKNAILTAGRWVTGGCSTTVGQEVNCWGNLPNPVTEGAELNRHLLDSGLGHACTVTDQGLVCWGSNNDGQLGVGTTEDSSVAVVVQDIPSVVDLATGKDHTCAIINDEVIKCWGLNDHGQLGNGTLENTSVPSIVL